MDQYAHIHTHSHQSYSSGPRKHSDWPHEHSHPHIHSKELDDNTRSHFHTFGARHNWVPYVPAPGEKLKPLVRSGSLSPSRRKKRA